MKREHVDMEALRERVDCRRLAEDLGLGIESRSGTWWAARCPQAEAEGQGNRGSSVSVGPLGFRCRARRFSGDAISLAGCFKGLRYPRDLSWLADRCRAAGGAELVTTPPGTTHTRAHGVLRLAPPGVATRMRALSLAWLHYSFLAGFHAGREDVQSVSEHLIYLVRAGGLPDGSAERVWRNRKKALAHLRKRKLLGGDGADVVGRLVGICPHTRTGLEEYLEEQGGEELVEAGRLAGLWVGTPGRAQRETMRGRVVFRWEDPEGRCTYLTGGLVPDLAEECNVRCRGGRPIESLSLGIWDERSDDNIGVARPAFPFGTAHALRLHSRESKQVLVVEREDDALAALKAGWPAVATGGAGRFDGEALRAALGDAEVAVVSEAGGEDAKAIELARDLGGSVVHFAATSESTGAPR